MENQELENVMQSQTDVTIGTESQETQCETETTQEYEQETKIQHCQEQETNLFSELDNTKERPIGVYAKYDENGNIKEVNSDIFITDFTGWTKIDEGFGDRYAHAQSQYLEHNID